MLQINEINPHEQKYNIFRHLEPEVRFLDSLSYPTDKICLRMIVNIFFTKHSNTPI